MAVAMSREDVNSSNGAGAGCIFEGKLKRGFAFFACLAD